MRKIDRVYIYIYKYQEVVPKFFACVYACLSVCMQSNKIEMGSIPTRVFPGYYFVPWGLAIRCFFTTLLEQRVFLPQWEKAVYLYVCMSVHIPAYVCCYVCMYVCKCMCKVPLIQYFSLVLCIRVYCLCIIFSTSPPPPSPINRQIGRYTYINSKRVFFRIEGYSIGLYLASSLFTKSRPYTYGLDREKNKLR